MKNDDSRNEKLAQWLIQTDDDLLDEAYSVDTAEKLKKRIESENIRAKTSLTRRAVLRGAIAAAACLAVTLGAVLTLPALLQTDDIIVNPKTSGSSDVVKPPRTDEAAPAIPPRSDATTPKTGALPGIELPTDNLRINSIDKLNYYSAVRILTDSSNSSLSRLSAGGRSPYGISLLSADVPYDPDNTPGPPLNQDPPKPSSPQPNDDPDIYYYEFDPDQVFYVHDVSFFQIELTDETGFLASKIGTGVADVVISDDFIFGDALITFKNGDRYFSCLHNSFHRDELTGRRTFRFSTHKYIEGFHVVKNFEQENYEFVVSFDGDQVDYFECTIWDRGTNPDGVLPVVSETYISNEIAEYTIADLEEYFNAGNMSERPPAVEAPSEILEAFLSDQYNLLILRVDGTFEYGHNSTYWGSWHPRRGLYEMTEDNLILRFYENGEFIEEAVISLLTGSGLYYNEERFIPYPDEDYSIVAAFYSDEHSRFALYADGTFEYKGVLHHEGRQGEYEMIGDDMILRYYVNGELVEESVNLSSEAFVYNGEIFYPCPTDA